MMKLFNILLNKGIQCEKRELIIGALLAHGVLKEVKIKNVCSKCTECGNCILFNNIRIYIINKKVKNLKIR